MINFMVRGKKFFSMVNFLKEYLLMAKKMVMEWCMMHLEK